MNSEKYPVIILKQKTSDGRKVKVRVQQGRSLIQINSEAFPRTFSTFAKCSEEEGREIIKTGLEKNLQALKPYRL